MYSLTDHSVGKIGIALESSVRCGYTVGKAVGVEVAAGSEVRLPQGLRFTDVRRSALGDYPLARGGSRASKSRRCLELRPLSRLVCPLRLAPTATFIRAHLRALLDGVSRSERKPVCALRRRAGRAGIGWCFKRRSMPGLPAGHSVLCAGGSVWTLSGPHEGSYSCTEV
jgi:hypothetical protein